MICLLLNMTYIIIIKNIPHIWKKVGVLWKLQILCFRFYHTFRHKSVNRFLKELEYVVSIYGTQIVYPFKAANFGVNV